MTNEVNGLIKQYPPAHGGLKPADYQNVARQLQLRGYSKQEADAIGNTFADTHGRLAGAFRESMAQGGIPEGQLGPPILDTGEPDQLQQDPRIEELHKMFRSRVFPPSAPPQPNWWQRTMPQGLGGGYLGSQEGPSI